MLKLKNQEEEKDLFKRQLLTLKASKRHLLVDLFFLVVTTICVFTTSYWFIIPVLVILYNIKNHFFDYRFNKAMALMIEQTVSFNISKKDKEDIEFFF